MTKSECLDKTRRINAMAHKLIDMTTEMMSELNRDILGPKRLKPAELRKTVRDRMDEGEAEAARGVPASLREAVGEYLKGKAAGVSTDEVLGAVKSVVDIRRGQHSARIAVGRALRLAGWTQYRVSGKPGEKRAERWRPRITTTVERRPETGLSDESLAAMKAWRERQAPVEPAELAEPTSAPESDFMAEIERTIAKTLMR